MIIQKDKIISSLRETVVPPDWSGASLFLITDKEFFLIKRSLSMPSHAGQMAFFGGMRKANEYHPVEVAVREFNEESLVDASQVEVLGTLAGVFTGRQQLVIPVVAWLKMSREEFFKKAVSNGEWTELMAISWDKAARYESWEWGWRHGLTESNRVLMLPLAPVDYQQVRGEKQGHILWGATARMVWSLLAHYYR